MNGSPPLPAANTPQPAMERVRVNGRELAFYCMGTGSPTVILETGLGAESNEWDAIQRSIGAITRVCRYDRAGRGASDAAPGSPRSASELVEDLRTLLIATRVTGPYILVGHSFGGLLVRLFAHRYPAEVCGLLLVDAMHEDQFTVIGTALPPPTPNDTRALCDFREFWTVGWRNPKSTAEGIDFVSSFREVQQIRSFGQLPVHIITAATALNSPFMPEQSRAALQALWFDLQRQFLGSSSIATQSYASDSGHFVQRDAPETVVEAIGMLIERSRLPPG
jgi:pimeloyl-ACP methyl ester carboxylesterase